jgi:hypothetical protein
MFRRFTPALCAMRAGYRELDPNEVLAVVQNDGGETTAYYAARYFGPKSEQKVNHILWNDLKKRGHPARHRSDCAAALVQHGGACLQGAEGDPPPARGPRSVRPEDGAGPREAARERCHLGAAVHASGPQHTGFRDGVVDGGGGRAVEGRHRSAQLSGASARITT